ncbi:MAG TPA: cytochrome C [Deltaproteobacteria bacterium]|nr:cytochrome C [Deltaproteobacteria bacterium]
MVQNSVMDMEDPMKAIRMVATLVVTAALIVPASIAVAGDALDVGYPEGYRDWTHVKSMVIFSDKHPLFGAFGGIHHVYANDMATKALKAKKPLPSGSAIVFDLLEISESSGAYVEGARKFVAVMEYNDKYKKSSGWGWQVFAGDTKDAQLGTLADQVACATCHEEVKSAQFVFSEWRK